MQDPKTWRASRRRVENCLAQHPHTEPRAHLLALSIDVALADVRP